MKSFILVLLVSLIAPPAYAVNLEEERNVGKNADRIIRHQFGVYKDKKLQEYITSIGQKLLESIKDPEFEYHFLILDDPMLNAFAVPGGYVYITRGMLAYVDSEAALAGVLGHEIGHVIGHHAFRKMEKSLGDTLLIFAGLGASLAAGGGGEAAVAWMAASSSLSQLSNAGYGRDMELQADEFGMIYSYDAGYDPRAQAKFFKMLQFKQRVSGSRYHGFLATHPDTIERIIKIGEKSEIIKRRGKPVMENKRRFLENIKGLAYGKGNAHSGIKPPYVIDIYTTSKGDSFRSIARQESGDESLAFEISMMNAMKVKDKLEPETMLKIPVKRSPR